MTEIVHLSALQARRLFQTGELSPVELMAAVIERAAKAEPVINAFCEQLFDQALEQAGQAEARYRDGTARPLEGIPVAAKEKHAIAGRTLTEGSLALDGTIATESHPVIERIQAAGGIIHARTTTPEFSIATYTHSRIWGVTRNPWNPDFTPGGSSGGSGASLAAGTSLLATGSDIGGSTRIPAAFNGVVGYKAPYGRIPGVAPMAADHYRGDGPMARTVADTIALANVMIGPDPRDHASLRPKLELPFSHEPVAGMRIALCIRLGDYEVHPEMEANTRAVAAALTLAGAVVEEIELPWTRWDVLLCMGAHFPALFGALVEEITADRRELVSSYTADYLDTLSRAREQITYFQGLRVETRLQRQLAEAMAGFDALLAPTTSIPGWHAGDDLKDSLVVNGVDYGSPLWGGMTMPFNISNRCPVLNVPSGMSSWGVPTGVQIVGHTYDDATVFRIGSAIEELRPWGPYPDLP